MLTAELFATTLQCFVSLAAANVVKIWSQNANLPFYGMNLFLKLASIVALLSCCALLQTYWLKGLSSAKRYKLYRFEAGVFLSLLIIPFSKFLWRCFTKDFLSARIPSYLHCMWKLLVAFVLMMTHVCPVTSILISKEPPFIVILSWLCLGTYMVLLLLLGFVKCGCYVVKTTIKPLNCTPFRQSVITLAVGVILIFTAFRVASNSPTIIR